MKLNDTLSVEFNIEQSEPMEIITADGEVVRNSSSKIEDDYDHARENLRKLLLDGQSALQTALSVAQQSEHPRAIEVVGNLIHQQKQKLDAPVKGDVKKEVTNNNAIFVGSTAELTKMIKNMTKGE